MENCVLLIQGSGSHLEVLREAWMRRALRSPRGFTIRAVGDLSPVQMSPISQSQFIPLSEVLCSAISDMNIAHIMVNQETLINHMTKAHPGMTIPTQDILYNALGALIKDRKIYHTGEGYFIVTPQTYFITNNIVKEKTWWPNDSEQPSSPPITYLMSNETCLDSSCEVPIMAHCKSCSCFITQTTAPPSIQEQSISISECTVKSGLKWPKEHKPTVQHQSTSTAADYQASEISKSTNTTRKEKEKPGRKFGLNLFRRNTGKKEIKVKKEYSTFCGQFPPEEWPVRDEDDLNNLPRDLEHAIIKRINPELTVDNLVRHTVLMKKLEEKTDRVAKALTSDKGMSTEILLSKQRHNLTKAGGKRSSSKANRSKRRSTSVKEKQRMKNKDDLCDEDVEGDDLIPSRLGPELVTDETANQNNAMDPDVKCVYKKRIEDPFQSMRDTGITHKEQRKREVKSSSRRERIGHRSKSWDPHRVKGVTEEEQKTQILKDRSCDQLNEKGLNLDSKIYNKDIKELPREYSSIYPDNSTLRIEDKVRQRDVQVRGRQFKDGRENDVKQKSLQENSLEEKHDMDIISHPYQSTEAPLPWPQPTVQRRLSLHLVNSIEEPDLSPKLLSSHQLTGSMTDRQRLVDSDRLCRDSRQSSEIHTEDEHRIYQKVDEDDDDCCSSLCLNVEHASELVHSGTARCREPVCLDGDWDSSFMEDNAIILHLDSIRATQRLHEYKWQPSEHQASMSHLPVDGSQSQKSAGLEENLNEPSLGCSDPTDTLDNSIFDYCQTSERDSDNETMLKSVDEGNGQLSSWNCQSQMKDFTKSQPEDTDDLQCASMSHSGRVQVCLRETGENQSNTADSGIDSPRTRMSLTSPNSVILKGLKQRNFLQNLEKLHSKSSSIHAQSSLLQLTPVMNV